MNLVKRCTTGEFGTKHCEFLGETSNPKEAKQIIGKDKERRKLLGLDKNM